MPAYFNASAYLKSGKTIRIARLWIFSSSSDRFNSIQILFWQITWEDSDETTGKNIPGLIRWHYSEKREDHWSRYLLFLTVSRDTVALQLYGDNTNVVVLLKIIPNCYAKEFRHTNSF